MQNAVQVGRHHVAVVGSGPAGMFAAQELLKVPQVERVDIIDRLPAPFGLVRYGVAPDHEKTKAVARAFGRVLDDARVRYVGNVEIGRDIPIETLEQCYDGVLFATGASQDHMLGIPGEHLPGSVSAAEFVAWYSGHPDAAPRSFDLRTSAAAVVGAGNVALDLVRLLAKDPESLRVTDMPDDVVDAFRRSTINRIHVLVRRGPADVKFTAAQLRELGEIDGVDVLLEDGHGLDSLDPGSYPRPAQDNLKVFEEWRARGASGAPRQIRFHFHTRPLELVCGGDGRLARLNVLRGASEAAPAAEGYLDVGLLLRAIGYRVTPVPGLPFDEQTSSVPNHRGRVFDERRTTPERRYVAGWLKRGPSGVIGTNRPDAAESVHTMLTDFASLPPRRCGGPDALLSTLPALRITHVDQLGWKRLEAYEAQLGAARGARSVKVSDLARMLSVCQASSAAF